MMSYMKALQSSDDNLIYSKRMQKLDSRLSFLFSMQDYADKRIAEIFSDNSLEKLCDARKLETRDKFSGYKSRQELPDKLSSLRKFLDKSMQGHIVLSNTIAAELGDASGKKVIELAVADNFYTLPPPYQIDSPEDRNIFGREYSVFRRKALHPHLKRYLKEKNSRFNPSQSPSQRSAVFKAYIESSMEDNSLLFSYRAPVIKGKTLKKMSLQAKGLKGKEVTLLDMSYDYYTGVAEFMLISDRIIKNKGKDSVKEKKDENYWVFIRG